MNMYFTAQNQGNIPATYDCDVCEGNWYEDRCTSQYDTKKKRDYLLPNPNAWQYETTYSDLGQNCKDYPTIKKHFQIANDDCINFQGMDYNMFITTNKHAMDPRYRESFRQPLNMKDYFKGKPEELGKIIDTWTKKSQLFDTTYHHDILNKTVKK